MKKYFIIEYFQKGIKNWVRHNFTDYPSFIDAKKEVESYNEYKLGIKFRILEVKEVAY